MSKTHPFEDDLLDTVIMNCGVTPEFSMGSLNVSLYTGAGVSGEIQGKKADLIIIDDPEVRPEDPPEEVNLDISHELNQ